jgi:hypothetical protein
MTRNVLLALTGVVAALAIIEGIASCVISFRDRRPVLWATGRRRSCHDPELGWVNRAGVRIDDAYGPGRHIRINGQGFRNDGDVAATPEAGRVRVICSGDSFTFGEGVDGEDVWCRTLESFDPRLEVVNMGQTGYGIDQAYLWYKRDGMKLEHDLHILQFITDDFYRMQKPVFAGYAKPMLDVAEDRLVVTNVPVPRRSFTARWLARQVKNVDGFRTVQLVNRVVGKLRRSLEDGAAEAADAKTRQIVRKILEDLARVRDEHSIQTVLLYLPTLAELTRRSELPERWGDFIASQAERLDLPFLNLFTRFRRLPIHEVVSMYIPQSEFGPNHVNSRGN